MHENKAFELGLLVGRFQTVHLGHEQMIETALKLCSRVGILIGSSQESGTEKNPFSYELRERLLRNSFGSAVEICPLPDLGAGNNSIWGEYVLKNAVERFGRIPDLLVSGKEERRTDWFEGTMGAALAELHCPKTIDISASRMRAFMIEGDKASWCRYVNPANYALFDTLHTLVLSSMRNTRTQSI